MDIQEEVTGMDIIFWCELCNQAQAEGTLTVIRKGELEPVDMQCCLICVSRLPKDQWLSNKLGGPDV